MKKMIITIQIALLVLSAAAIAGQTNEQTSLTAELLSRIEFRNIGPDITPGRISDIAIDPYNKHLVCINSIRRASKNDQLRYHMEANFY